MENSNVNTKENNTMKKYVFVTVAFSPEGAMRPMCIVWEDGRKYMVERVLDVRRAASLKGGGTGLRFTCQIEGRPHYLFYEENYKWFVEGKQ